VSVAKKETVLDSRRQTHLGIWRDEHDDITRDFYRWDVADLPRVCREAMAAGVRQDLEGMHLGNVTDYCSPVTFHLRLASRDAPTEA